MSDVVHQLDKDPIRSVLLGCTDKFPINFQVVGDKILQIAEGGKTGSKVVQGEAKPGRPKALDSVARGRDIRDHRRFSNLEGHPAWVYAGAFEGSLDKSWQRLVAQGLRRKVHSQT